MNFTRPNATGAKLNEYKDMVVALADLGMTVQDTEWGRKPALRARFLAIDPTGTPVDLGETLVFSESVFKAIQAKKGDALVGTLREVNHPTQAGWTYWVVEDLTDDAFQSAVVKLSTLNAS